MRNICVAITGIVLLFGSIGISNVYAQELSYDNKLEFSLKIHQITGHVISALDDTIEKEYTLAKMHLLHPLAEHSDIINFLSKDSACSQKLSLILNMIQATDPKFDKKVTDQRFSYILQTLKNCNALVVGEHPNSNFTLDVIGKILDKSVLEYESSTYLKGMGQIMEQQDSISLVIRAKILLNDVKTLDEKSLDTINELCNKLMIAHINKEPLSEIVFLTSTLQEKLGLDNTDNLNSTSNLDLTSNITYLKKIKYSSDLMMLEIHGKNFVTKQKITVEYFNPTTEKLETIHGTSTSDGEFGIPFMFVDNSFDDSMMFSITINDQDVLYEILSIS